MTRACNFARLCVSVLIVAAGALAWQAPQPPAPQPAPQTPPQTAPAQIPAPVVPPPPVPAPPRPSETIVIDPGHGGADAGARGSSGIIEKDFTMFLAVLLRDELQRQGLRATITRQQDENPGFDERAAFANAFARPIFISLHAASTGQPGTVRAYYSRVSPPAPPSAEAETQRSSLPPWDEAQNRYLDDSRRLAQQVQSQLTERFASSPQSPMPGALRQLKSITGPAIAVEISSVAVKERKTLDQMAGGMVAAIARGIAIFRGSSAPPGVPQ